MKQLSVTTLVATLLLILSYSSGNAQSTISFNGGSVNAIDKKKRKQGEWIFFNSSGIPVMTCLYKDDHQAGPNIFFKNGDTAFIRFPRKDSVETFVVYYSGEKFFGNFVHTSKDKIRTEIESTGPIQRELVELVSTFKNIELKPVYHFGKSKPSEHLAAQLSSSSFIFNKSIQIILTISGAGHVKKVEFAKDSPFLSDGEQRELEWIFSTMPRWQPLFRSNATNESKVKFNTSSSIVEWI